VELFAGGGLDPGLHAKVLVPDNALEDSGYTNPTMTAVASSWGQKRARSAMPPEMMAGMAAAKVSRKKNFTSS
jgi:hypothetical protein